MSTKLLISLIPMDGQPLFLPASQALSNSLVGIKQFAIKKESDTDGSRN